MEEGGWQALDAFLNVEPVLEKGYKADAGKNATRQKPHNAQKLVTSGSRVLWYGARAKSLRASPQDLGTDYPVAMRKAFAYGFGASPTFGPVLLNFHMSQCQASSRP